MRKYVRSQKGFTLIETMIVLAIALIVLLSSTSLGDIVFGNSSATEETKNVQELFLATKSLKTTSGYGAATTDLVPQLIATKQIPKTMTVNAGLLYNEWNGNETVVSNGSTFTYTAPSLPQDVCIKVATKISKTGTYATTAINGNAAITGEVTTAVATTQCNSPAANTVVWVSAS